nr:hypothetical protein [uncultured Dethiosulfovibrio sp.]
MNKEASKMASDKDLMKYIENFLKHYRILIQRYNYFKDINDKCNNNTLNIHNEDVYRNVLTYLDIIVVQLRSMCIENNQRKQNYTVQNLLKKVGEDSLAKKIDDMLDKELLQSSKLHTPTSKEPQKYSDLSIRLALKILADKFICHHDDCKGGKDFYWTLAGHIEIALRNPYCNEKNLDFIVTTIEDCVKEGLSLEKYSISHSW